MCRIDITAKKDYRSYPEGYKVSFDFSNQNIIFLMGLNGCGKSTLIQAIRGKMNSNNDNEKKWHAKSNCKEILENFDVEISGFENIYHLDVDGLDNGLSMWNAASATDLVDLGGFGMNTVSSGEQTYVWLSRMKMQVKDSENTLLIFDELDNHLDYSHRVKLIAWFNKLWPKSKKLIVTHDLVISIISNGQLVVMNSSRDENPMSCKLTGTEPKYWKDEDKEFFFTLQTGYMLKNLISASNKENEI